VDLENAVNYLDDTGDVTRLATDTHATTPLPLKAFERLTLIADIVAVNGKQVKGNVIGHALNLTLKPGAATGQSLADITRNGVANWTVEFLQSDGTQIGTIFLSNLNGGTPPPGAPALSSTGNFTVVGGTGAFLGARGQGGAILPQAVTPRTASVTEDPALRRTIGGGTISFVIQVFPQEAPQIVSTANGPAIVHANTNQLITTANPARAGETLVLYATGLGPAKGVEFGQTFPVSPLAPVVAPVEITVNGTVAPVSYAGGYPGAVDGYQVNFTLPTGIAAGVANLQLSAAWIPGSAVMLPVQ
jgi:uncharacterized protein (TIGR03437 family)